MMNRKFAMGLALFSGLAFTHSLQAASFSCNAAKQRLNSVFVRTDL